MRDTKVKKNQRLRKARVWPSIIMFIGFLVLCLSMIAIFVEMFATYIVGMRLAQMYEDTRDKREIFDVLMKNERTIEGAVIQMDKYLVEDSAVCIINREKEPVAINGDSEPNFEYYLEISMLGGMKIIGDATWESGMNSIVGIRMDEIFEGAFATESDYELENSEWLQEAIVNQRVWLAVPCRDGQEEYMLCVRYTLQILRQDILYVSLFGIFMFLVLLIPIVLLFINTVKEVITQRKMVRLFYLDNVTGGKNWLYFQSYASRIVNQYYNSKKTYAVINLHLERYTNYCACHGVEAGEELLGAVDGFLKVRTNRGEIFARYEGADFGLLLCCEKENIQENMMYIQKRLCSLLAELTGLRANQKINFYAGIYMIYPDMEGNRKKGRKSIDIDQCYSYARTAKDSTKCHEGHRISFFDQEMLQQQMWERKVEDTMEAALNNEEFQVYLQPKCSPLDGKVLGAEALVRWINPTEGCVEPERFISIFEDNGFITKLDEYMISRVAKQQAEWTIQGKKLVPISVNVSRAHVMQEGFAEKLCQLVDAYGPSHELVEIEITESAFFDDKDILVENVRQLKGYGFKVAMDDFGAGYSSLNSLKDIPLDELKLDREFFAGNDEDGRASIVVHEIIRLAKNLGMRVAAEGVEKREQVDFLARNGCDTIQGLYFAEPMSISDFVEKMENEV